VGRNHSVGFWGFLRQANGFWEHVGKGALATSPIGVVLLNFGPPWPNLLIVGIITIMVELVAAICFYQFLREKPEGSLRRWLVFCCASVVAFLTVYTCLFAIFVHPAPDHLHRVVGGWEYAESAKSFLLIKRETVQDDNELLKDMGFHADHVWSNKSLVIMRLVVLLSWVSLFVSFTAMVLVFLCLQTCNSEQLP
jgi:Na+/melibiose symporter-like transporter